MPLWCPYANLGYPFFADLQSGLFDPITCLFAGFTHYTLFSNNAEFLLHVLIAVIGMRALLLVLNISRPTATLFGVVYALSGTMVGNATHSTLVASLSYIPCILASYSLLLLSKSYKYAMLCAVLLFLQIVSGYAGLSMILVYVIASCFFYFLFFVETFKVRHFIRLLPQHILLVALSTLLSAGFLYAISLGMPYSTRAGTLSQAHALSVPFPPLSLFTLYTPLAASAASFLASDTDITMANLYIGIIPCLFMLSSLLIKPTRFTIAVALFSVFCLLAAMGSHTPLRGWLYGYVPLMGYFRHTAIFRFYTCIGFILLAAISFDTYKQQNQPYFSYLVLITMFLAGGIVVYALVAKKIFFDGSVFASLYAFSTYIQQAAKWNILCLGACLHLLLLTPVVLALFLDRLTTHQLKGLFSVIILIDMSVAVQLNLYGTVVGHRPLAQLQHTIDTIPENFSIPQNSYLSSYGDWTDTTLAPLWRNSGIIHQHIAYIGFNGFELQAYHLIADKSDFQQIISHRKYIEVNTDSTTVRIAAFSPNAVCLETTSAIPFTLSIGQMYFKGWRLTVDGQTSNDNLAVDSMQMMKAEISNGTHQVRVSFEPKWVDYSWWISMILFVLTTLGTFAFFRRCRV